MGWGNTQNSIVGRDFFFLQAVYPEARTLQNKAVMDSKVMCSQVSGLALCSAAELPF